MSIALWRIMYKNVSMSIVFLNLGLHNDVHSFIKIIIMYSVVPKLVWTTDTKCIFAFLFS